MEDPMLDQFCRANTLQSHFFRQFQRYCRDVIQPKLNEREALLEENARLKADLEKLTAKKARTAVPA